MFVSIMLILFCHFDFHTGQYIVLSRCIFLYISLHKEILNWPHGTFLHLCLIACLHDTFIIVPCVKNLHITVAKCRRKWMQVNENPNAVLMWDPPWSWQYYWKCLFYQWKSSEIQTKQIALNTWPLVTRTANNLAKPPHLLSCSCYHLYYVFYIY